MYVDYDIQTNIDNYDKMVDSLTKSLMEDIEKIRTKVDTDLKEVQNRIIGLLSKQKESYRKEYDEFEDLVNKLFGIWV